MTTPSNDIDLAATRDYILQKWDSDVKDSLFDYCRVPNQSPAYDPEWATNGLLEQALAVITKWVDEQDVVGLTRRVEKIEGFPELLFMSVDAFDGTNSVPTDPSTPSVLAYGHYDSQPPMGADKWDTARGIGPYTPIIIEENDADGTRVPFLYGRAVADDAYAAYCIILAIKSLQLQGRPHPRIMILIEGAEESASLGLDLYLNKLKDDLGNIQLVICTDSGCNDYKRLWLTSSLRGMVYAKLSVQIATHGTHSGASSGVMPSTFRILRQLLDRIEDSATGRVLLDTAHVEIPAEHLEYAKQTCDLVGAEKFFASFPFLDGVSPMTNDALEGYLNKSWRPTLSYIGMDGIPSSANAGAVLRPNTDVVLSVRLPPTANPDAVLEEMQAKLSANPPYGANITLSNCKTSSGFLAPTMAPWLQTAVEQASQQVWGGELAFIHDGVSIPFLNLLQHAYPTTQFAVVGLLHVEAAAHSVNEKMHIPYFHNLCQSLPKLLVEFGKQFPIKQ